MISLKVLSAAAALALVVPLAAPTESFAQAGGGALSAGRGGGINYAPGARVGGGGARIGAGVPSARFNAGVPSARFNGAPARQFNGAPARQFGGGNYAYHGGNIGGHRYHRRPHRFGPSVVIGAGIASSYGYYGSPGYYDPGYYEESYYDDSAAVVAEETGPETIAECKQRFRSYDVRSQTYLGYDGLRHPCPAI